MQMIVQTESIHEIENEILRISGGSYFRLNIGLDIDIRLDEWQKLVMLRKSLMDTWHVLM